MDYLRSIKNKDSIKNSILCFLSGSMSTLFMYPNNFFVFLIFFIFGFNIILKSSDKKNIFLLSWFFSFGWFFAGLYWIGFAFLLKSTAHLILLPFAVTFLPAILAFFWAIGFVFAFMLSERVGNKYVWVTIILSFIEFLRGNFLNFPWLMPGTLFASSEISLQSFSFVGSYTMNICFFSLVIFVIMYFKIINAKMKYFIVLVLPIFLILLIGAIRYFNKSPLKETDNFLISIVQPNIKQDLKWKSNLKKDHINNLVSLSKNNKIINRDYTRLIIWPETSFPGIYPRDKVELKDITQILLDENEYLFTGILHIKDNKIYNSSLLMSNKNLKHSIYNKSILVPFGEYVPFRNFLPKISSFVAKNDFHSDKELLNIKVGEKKFLPLICYEIIFNRLIYKNIRQDTNLIINITNDAWFGNSIGPHQHLQFARVRAVEFGVPTVRVANTGISAYFDPYGKLISKIPLNTRDIMTHKLINNLQETIFKKYGNNIFYFILFYLTIINILLFNYKKRKFT